MEFRAPEIYNTIQYNEQYKIFQDILLFLSIPIYFQDRNISWLSQGSTYLGKNR